MTLLLGASSLAVWLAAPEPCGACTLARGSEYGLVHREVGRLPRNALGVLFRGMGGPNVPRFTLSEWAEAEPLAAEGTYLGKMGVFVSSPEDSERLRRMVEEERAADAGVPRMEPDGRPLTRFGASWLWAVRPRGGFRPGHTYVVQYDPAPGDRTPYRAPVQHAVVTIDDREVGGTFRTDLRIGAPVCQRIYIAGGPACATQTKAQVVEIELVLPEHIQPYAPYLYYETFVDGEPWEPMDGSSRVGSSGVGPAKDRLHSLCALRGDSLELVQCPMVKASMRARLPGTDLLVTSGEHEVHFFDSPRDRGRP